MRMKAVANERICKNCGNGFTLKPHQAKRKLNPDYCGKTCKTHAYWKRRIERELKVR